MSISVNSASVKQLQELVTQRYLEMVANQEEAERQFESLHGRPMSEDDYLAKDDNVEVRVATDAYLASWARWSMTRQQLQDVDGKTC